VPNEIPTFKAMQQVPEHLHDQLWVASGSIGKHSGQLLGDVHHLDVRAGDLRYDCRGKLDSLELAEVCQLHVHGNTCFVFVFCVFGVAFLVWCLLSDKGFKSTSSQQMLVVSAGNHLERPAAERLQFRSAYKA
jgi:hypothetical protein